MLLICIRCKINGLQTASISGESRAARLQDRLLIETPHSLTLARFLKEDKCLLAALTAESTIFANFLLLNFYASNS